MARHQTPARFASSPGDSSPGEALPMRRSWSPSGVPTYSRTPVPATAPQPHSGNGPCDSCEILIIQGVRTHETGCPVSWKDYARDCAWCGSVFMPEEKHQRFCEDSCAESFNS